MSVGSPLGFADRLNLSVNSDIDQELSDSAWGGTVGYDFAWGYWLLGADASYQRYKDEVQGALVAFDTDGHSGYAQADISRVLYRSRLSRFSLGLFRRQDDIRNRINDNTIRVSSYRLSGSGMRVEGSHLVGRYQFGGSLSAEHMKAEGPAAELLLEQPVADESSWRYKLFASALRDLPGLKSTLQLQLNAQHSDDRLYPVKQLSLGAFVQGYEDVALTGNSAATLTTEFSLRPRQFGSWSVRPFLTPQAGWVLANNEVQESQRMASLVAGAALAYRRVGLNMDVAWPWDRASTVESGNEYVLRASFSVSY
jgi:hemolysin activation/secretion protein